jgi:hypothetical protein
MKSNDEIILLEHEGKEYIEFDSFLKFLRSNEEVPEVDKELVDTLNRIADFLETRFKNIRHILQESNEVFDGKPN